MVAPKQEVMEGGLNIEPEIFMIKIAILPALASLVLLTTTASAATLADGTYSCTIGTAHLGDILIDKGEYAGPAYDGKYEQRYSFTVSDAGTIDWGGPLGGISAAGKIVSSVLTDAGGGRIGFDITIQNESANFQTINCSPE